MDLEILGWNEKHESNFTNHRTAGHVPGRVSRVERDACAVRSAAGPCLARLSGRLRHDGCAQPAVGDWVALEPNPGDNSATIRAILPRSSALERKRAGQTTHAQVLVANIDWLILVMGLDGDFNPRRVERYMTLAWNSGSSPVVVLNKADLCDDVPERIAEIEACAIGVPVHAISAASLQEEHPLRPYQIVGRTLALVGSSGAGKTTLINALCDGPQQRTQAVRTSDDRGRHTTTWRELFVMPPGGVIIDTPGLREVQLWGDEDGLDSTFSDIQALAPECRYRDCTHAHEPGCAVRAAVDRDELDPARLESFHKLARELRHLHLRQNHLDRQQERARWRVIHKSMRQNHKRTGR